MFKESWSASNTAESRENIKEEEIRKKREKYSGEFQKKPLSVDSVDPKQYTQEMRDADLGFIEKWIDFEIEKIGWLKDELVLLKNRRFETASNQEERREVVNWFSQNVVSLNNQIQDKWKEYHEIRKRVVDTYNCKKDFKKEEEERKKKQEEEIMRKTEEKERKKKEEAERKKKEDEERKKKEDEERKKREDEIRRKKEEEEKQRRKPSSGRTGTESKTENPNGNETKKAEQIAIQELGISQSEFNMITGDIRMLKDNELLRLTMKVMGVKDRNEIKKAYHDCARKWHPDTRNTRYGIGVNEAKFKIANNLYGEYVKRFAK
jgi:hypothetical protein